MLNIYRAPNESFGKIDRTATEDVWTYIVIQLLWSKCIPVCTCSLQFVEKRLRIPWFYSE